MKILILLHLILAPFLIHGSESDDFLIVGKVVSFDEQTVRVKSGDRVFQFTKAELLLPGYRIGQDVNVKLTKGQSERFFSKKTKQSGALK